MNGLVTYTITFDTTDSPFNPLPAHNLKSYVDEGNRVVLRLAKDDPTVIATLVLRTDNSYLGRCYEMAGVTGVHRLNAAPWATDTERLAAHWLGFMQNARDKALKR